MRDNKGEDQERIGDVKGGKATGIDSISADLLRVDADTTVQIFHTFFSKIWEDEVLQRAYHQASQERRSGELRELERYHPHIHCSEGVGKNPE